MSVDAIKALKFHGIALAALLIITTLYFAPIFSGKVLGQYDNIQARGMQQEMWDVKKETGEFPLWTNSMFSGMPTYQIMNRGDNAYHRYFNKAFMLGRSYQNPWILMLAGMFGMYFLLAVMKIDWKFALLGALAYGFGTMNIDLLHAGHSTKLMTMAYCAPTLAGVILAYRGKFLAGMGIAAMFTALQVYSNHMQITYYFFLLLGIYGLVELGFCLKEGKIMRWVKASAVLIFAFAIGIGANTSRLLTTQEYSSETIRGKSELTQKEVTEGLDKGYAWDYCISKSETFSVLVPNFMGGTSSKAFVSDPKSKTYQALGRVQNRDVQGAMMQLTTHYWGEQPVVGASGYLGAIVIFLFILGLILVPGRMKWWIGISSIFILIVAWGKHFGPNNFLFDHFPMFNKFRAVSMIMGVGQITTAILAVLGLRELFNAKRSIDLRRKSLLIAGGVTGGLIVFLLIASYMMSYGTNIDAETLIRMGIDPSKGLPGDFVDALIAERGSLLRMDALRSLAFVGLAFGALFLYFKGTLTKQIAVLGVVLLAFIDLAGVAWRYVNPGTFEDKIPTEEVVKARDIDTRLQGDPEAHYRVFDLSYGNSVQQGGRPNPFNTARVSYFHKHVGGYHAAKLMIYQELIEKHLGSAVNPNVLAMLNTKYVLTTNPQTGKVEAQGGGGLGNAWFVKALDYVPTADTELTKLTDFRPDSVAIVQEKFRTYLGNAAGTGEGSIRLTSYHPDHMVYESNTSSDQVAIFSEVYYPPSKGWNVYIDGTEVDPFVKSDYVLRALKVPAGKHTIEMKFEPSSFYNGRKFNLIGSILSIIAFFVGMFFLYKAVANYDAPEEPEDLFDVKTPQKAKATQSKVKKTKKKGTKKASKK